MTYWIFLLPIIAGVITQLIKVIIGIITGRFSWNLFKKYGGMPSSHSAFVFGLLTEITLLEGFYSAAFATALILVIITVRDATGFRRIMDQHAQAINKLSASLPATEQGEIPHLLETIGHTPLQITIGAILGVVIVLLGNLLVK